MRELKINNVHSIYYRKSESNPMAVLIYYRRVRYLFITQLVKAYSDINACTELDSFYVIENDPLFSVLPRDTQINLYKIILEFIYSPDNSNNELDAALYFIRHLSDFIMIKTLNQIGELTEKRCGTSYYTVLETDEIPKTGFFGVRNVTYFGDFSDSMKCSITGSLRYMTFPAESKPIAKELTKECIKKVYTVGVHSSSQLVDLVKSFAMRINIDSDELWSSVMCYLITKAFTLSDDLKGVDLFHSQFDVLVKRGVYNL